jgi:hypothetical protein
VSVKIRGMNMLSWEEFEEKEKEIQPVKAQIPEKKSRTGSTTKPRSRTTEGYSPNRKLV